MVPRKCVAPVKRECCGARKCAFALECLPRQTFQSFRRLPQSPQLIISLGWSFLFAGASNSQFMDAKFGWWWLARYISNRFSITCDHDLTLKLTLKNDAHALLSNSRASSKNERIGGAVADRSGRTKALEFSIGIRISRKKIHLTSTKIPRDLSPIGVFGAIGICYTQHTHELETEFLNKSCSS